MLLKCEMSLLISFQIYEEASKVSHSYFFPHKRDVVPHASVNFYFNNKPLYLPSVEATARSLSMVSIPQATVTASSRRAIAYSAPWRAISAYHPEEYISAFKSVNSKETTEVSNDGQYFSGSSHIFFLDKKRRTKMTDCILRSREN